MKNTISSGKIFRTLLIGTSLIVLNNSCSDESLYDKTSTGENRIRFEFSTVSFGTRSGSSSTRGGAIKILSEESIFYLNPTITPGINSESSGDIVTRSTSVDNSTIADFGVFAETVSSGLYMNNVKISRDNGWSPEVEYLWPGKEQLTFTAYSPYGIVSSDNDGDWIIDYTTPADVSDQEDILWATRTTTDSSPIHLDFNHALSAIKFVTGSEMTPCVVKSITIGGIPSKGILNIKDGEWSEISTPSEFTVNLSDASLKAGSGSEYVVPGSRITSEDETFMMIPGTLPEGATISMTIEIDGKESTYTASVGGQEWPEGSTVTYRLSAKPETNKLVLDVVGTFETPYPGQTVPFQVKSCYINERGDSVPVSWKSEFIDDDGKVIDAPEWVKSFPAEGVGLDYTKAVTKMQRLTFTKLSAESRKLQDTPNVNVTSGNTPYNLSNSTGATDVQNTANCYIVNAPGKYSFPLVYGNAIKNGADNKSSYTSTSHNKYALKSFVNHLNNPITSPYIYENSGCNDLGDAILVWEGRLDLIRNVSLNSDNTISFEVPEESIRQGNAIIALRDKKGTVIWSWDIWVTDYVPDTDLAQYTVSGHTYRYYQRNVGRIMGGDVTVFPHCQVKVRFTQVGEVPKGMEPLTTTILLNQTGITTETIDCYNFYQWGRKDPIKSSLNEWFDADHYEIKELPIKDLSQMSVNDDFIPLFIKNPEAFFRGSHDYVFPYTNLWNSSLSSDSPKTIYDPSPVGAKVPYGTGLLNLIKETPDFGTAVNGSHSAGLYFTLPDGTKMFFPELGYRSSQTASEWGGYGANGTIWLSQPAGGTLGEREAGSIVMDHTSAKQEHNPRLHGFGVRPILE